MNLQRPVRLKYLPVPIEYILAQRMLRPTEAVVNLLTKTPDLVLDRAPGPSGVLALASRHTPHSLASAPSTPRAVT